jgi:uncharacterized protein (TIGR03086 family)
VLNHVTGGADMFAICVNEGSIADDKLMQLVGGDNLGDDYRRSFKSAASRAISAFEQPDVGDKMVTLPFGQMPAGVALRIAIFDVSVHTLDLARGSGQDVEVDAEVLETALAVGKEMIGPELRGPGLFDAEVTVADDAPLADRVLAFAGRRP